MSDVCKQYGGKKSPCPLQHAAARRLDVLQAVRNKGSERYTIQTYCGTASPKRTISSLSLDILGDTTKFRHALLLFSTEVQLLVSVTKVGCGISIASACFSRGSLPRATWASNLAMHKRARDTASRLPHMNSRAQASGPQP